MHLANTVCAVASVAMGVSSVAAEPDTLADGAAQKIKHVVLLMQENRSFDHMCGFFPNVNGLTGNEFNLVDTKDPNSKVVKVGNTSPYIGPYDPDHSVPGTTTKIFGQQCLDNNCTIPTMSGFVEYDSRHHSLDSVETVMNMFTPDRLPIMSTLANEFALFDSFYAAVPGPTWPNRLFQLMGTSKGDTATNQYNPHTFLYTGRTIFDIVEEAGQSWGFYYADAPLEMALIEKLTLHPTKIHGWKRFKDDISHGNLPYFSWVNPRWFVNRTSNEGANDQHPDHDVRLGEALMKEVYEDLRASPAWNETLFIITYDEHGGFYDHVAPPKAPAPDDHKSYPDEFAFDRLGVRIPTLLISPWVSKGTVISKPLPEEMPAEDSEYDLTSVIATVRKLLGHSGKSLSKRDAWAATFETRLSEPTARTDCPMTLPDAPKSLGAEHAAQEGALEMNHLQEDIVNAFELLHKHVVPSSSDNSIEKLTRPVLQSEGSEWIENVVTSVFNALQKKQN